MTTETVAPANGAATEAPTSCSGKPVWFTIERNGVTGNFIQAEIKRGKGDKKGVAYPLLDLPPADKIRWVGDDKVDDILDGKLKQIFQNIAAESCDWPKGADGKEHCDWSTFDVDKFKADAVKLSARGESLGYLMQRQIELFDALFKLSEAKQPTNTEEMQEFFKKQQKILAEAAEVKQAIMDKKAKKEATELVAEEADAEDAAAAAPKA